jgi:hypothetical protein
MTEKSAVTPSARSVQIKKKAPPDLAIATPTAAPFMWMMGTTNARSDPGRMMTYPDRPSASTNVPYSQTTKIGTAMRFESVPGSIPRTISSVR